MNETSWMATFASAPSPNFLVTFRKSTSSGGSFAAPGGLESFCSSAISLPLQIGKEQPAAQPPKLIAHDRDQDNDHNNCKNRGGVSAPFGDGNQITQTSFGVDDLRENDPAPTHAVNTPQVLPNICLRDGKQNMPHQLPLRRSFGHGHIQVGGWNIRDGFDDQGQQRHK